MLKVLSRRRTQAQDPNVTEMEPGVLLRALDDIVAKAATGRLAVLTASGGRARLFIFEGEIYAVELDGYRPPVDRRLHSGAHLDSARYDELMEAEPTVAPALRARTAVARDWVPIEVLGSVHQEFVLSAFGSVMDARVVSTKFTEGIATGEVCAMPAQMHVFVTAAGIRKTRMLEDWARVFGSLVAADCVLAPLGSELPADCQMPEFSSMFQALDGRKSLARAAFECGYTLAEAVHLVSALGVRGCVVVAAEASAQTEVELLVPESFPTHTGAGTSEEPATVVPPSPPEAEFDGKDALDTIDEGRIHDVEAARLEALSQELVRAQAHVEYIRAQLDLMGPVPADV
ncbi:MAG: hypothetical protein Q7K25_06410 [Actinomycetota bacterium]|nr:hypothetical protein [Actinomycetota bacterium]